MQLLPYGGGKSGLGWTHVMEKFRDQCLPRMQANSTCHVLLLIDFDNKGDQRRSAALELAGVENYPELRNRLFILSAARAAKNCWPMTC